MTLDNRIASTCHARHDCRRHGTERCNAACPWLIEVTYQLALSDIPDEYRVAVEQLPQDREHIDSLRHFAAVAAERKPKNGLFLTSATTGNGKTEAACAVAMSFILARTKRSVTSGVSAGQLVQFVNVVDLLDSIKAGFNDDNARVRSDALLARIAKAEMVVLDDFGSARPTDFVAERFYAMLDGIWRARSRQTLVVTSNLTLDNVSVTLGERVRSRIDGLCVVTTFKGSDRRRKKYDGGAR